MYIFNERRENAIEKREALNVNQANLQRLLTTVTKKKKSTESTQWHSFGRTFPNNKLKASTTQI